MNRRDWLGVATARLKAAGIEAPHLVAQLILARTVGTTREQLIAHDDHPLDEPLAADATAMIERRLAGEPLAYILEEVEFYGHRFVVGPEVLIPNSDTELLVNVVLEAARPKGDSPRPWKLLDIGTGSACIPIAIALEDAAVEAIGVDISEDALGIGYENVLNHRLTDRIRLFVGDAFAPVAELPDWHGKIDVVTSNPPYVDPADRTSLRPEVLSQPPVALFAGDAGAGGTAFHRRLLYEARPWVKKGGFLVMELGVGQAKTVTAIASELPEWKAPIIHHDMAGIPRVFVCQRA